MFTTVPTQAGLNFYEWQDVLHEVKHGEVLPDWHLDSLEYEEIRYLDLEAETCQNRPETPQTVLFSRGVGNWQSPRFGVVIYEIPSLLKKVSFKWEGLRFHLRPRPFSTNVLDRQFMARLLDEADLPLSNFYFTPAVKTWLNWEDSVDLLRSELQLVKPQRIICFGNNTAAYMRKYIRPDVHALERPNREQIKLEFGRIVRGVS